MLFGVVADDDDIVDDVGVKDTVEAVVVESGVPVIIPPDDSSKALSIILDGDHS